MMIRATTCCGWEVIDSRSSTNSSLVCRTINAVANTPRPTFSGTRAPMGVCWKFWKYEWPPGSPGWLEDGSSTMTTYLLTDITRYARLGTIEDIMTGIKGSQPWAAAARAAPIAGNPTPALSGTQAPPRGLQSSCRASRPVRGDPKNGVSTVPNGHPDSLSDTLRAPGN